MVLTCLDFLLQAKLINSVLNVICYVEEKQDKAFGLR